MRLSQLRQCIVPWMALGALLVAGVHVSAQQAASPEPAVQQSIPDERFEVASIRPSHPDPDHISISNSGSARFIERNYPFSILICMAYGVSSDRLHLPGWMQEQYYDIDAKAEGDAPRTGKQFNVMLRHLLEERFHMQVHHVTAYQSGYALIAAKGGARLKAVDSKITAKQKQSFYILPGALQMPNASIRTLANTLAHMLGKPVVEKTGLSGYYQFNFEFAPMDDANSTKPSMTTALEEQFGLKLAPEKNIPIDEVVVDSADRSPTEN
ncbi:MAG: TIGR03435 family protein [Terracidiphilus sp.]|nr:TIGR03435 family protein [Terracidiphilus sp.]